MFRIVSPKRYKFLWGRNLDFLYRLSAFEWRGSFDQGEKLMLFEAKILLIQIDIQEREMDLGRCKKPVLSFGNKERNPLESFDIYECCDFFQWQYNRDNILN